MRRVLGVLALLVSATLAAPATASADEPVPTDPEPTGPLRVMVVGDSITHSCNGEASYRYHLWQELQRQGVDVDFVGPHVAPRKRPEARKHYWFSDFDQDHAARAGTTFAYHLEREEEWFTTYRPQVVLLLLGINDATTDEGEDIAADTAAYLQAAWEIDPEIRFVLGQITSTGDPTARAGKNPSSATANDLVAKAFADDPRVTIAHTREGGTAPVQDWDPDLLTFDGTHPNATGETFLAHRFAQALQEAGVLPDGDIDVFRTVRWDPRPRTAVSVEGRRVTMSWLPAKLRLFGAREKVLITRRTGGRVAVSGWRAESAWTVRLPRGRYVARIVPRKGTMVGRYGTGTAFTVL